MRTAICQKLLIIQQQEMMIKLLTFLKKQVNVYGVMTAEQGIWLNNKVNAIKKEWAVEMKEMNDHLGYI